MTIRPQGSARAVQSAAAGLGRFNALRLAAVRQALLACCASSRWVEQVAAGRPYGTVEAALRQSDTAVADLADSDIAEALAAHPRIGERPDEREQAGVRGAQETTMTELAAANAAYERRFGHLYLVCATGRSAVELLSLLRSRLSNDPATEWRIVRAELGKINRIRLRMLIEGET